MIISYLDQMAKEGGWPKAEDDMDVSLFEFDQFKMDDEGKPKTLLWRPAGEIRVPREWIPYNDSDDTSTEMIRSWQNMYCQAAPLTSGQNGILGGNYLFKDGGTTLGGMAKAAAYLMFSAGFLDWLAKYNSEWAVKLRAHVEIFDTLCEPNTKKLPNNWYKTLDKELARKKMVLPVVGRMPDNILIVLGIQVPHDYEHAQGYGLVNLDVSSQLTRMMRLPSREATRTKLTAELHASKGNGRNIFLQEVKKPELLPDDEYSRLLGPIYVEPRDMMMESWTHCVRYPVQVAPLPDGSELLFFPTESAPYTIVQQIVEAERGKREMFMARKEQQDWAMTDADERLSLLPGALLPTPRKACAMLTVVEEGNQSKRVILEHFPVLPLQYWQLVEEEFRKQHLYSQITIFTRAARAGREEKGRSDTASVFALWTDVFRRTLGRHFISILPFWNSFQRYAVAFSTDKLIGLGKEKYGKANNYLSLLRALRRLQHLIGMARETDAVNKSKFYSELEQVETANLIIYGVIDPMNTELPTTAEPYIGETYQLLYDWQKQKIDEFVRRAWQGAPSEQFASFTRGTLVGMLLHEMDYALEQEGRSFSPTLGRHPCTLRGEALLKPFAKGTGLLQNINKSKRFNMRMLPFINSVIRESRTDAFNNGLIMGLAYIPEKSLKKDEEQEQ